MNKQPFVMPLSRVETFTKASLNCVGPSAYAEDFSIRQSSEAICLFRRYIDQLSPAIFLLSCPILAVLETLQGNRDKHELMRTALTLMDDINFDGGPHQSALKLSNADNSLVREKISPVPECYWSRWCTIIDPAHAFTSMLDQGRIPHADRPR